MDVKANTITFYYDTDCKMIKTFSSYGMKIHIEGDWVRIEKLDGRVIMVNTDDVKYYIIDK